MKSQGDFFKPSGFFTVDRRSWRAACKLGRNPAVAYLVLACGTKGNLGITTWSFKAIHKYTNIKPERSKPALSALIDAGLIRQNGDSEKPLYSLVPFQQARGHNGKNQNLIFLPNEIVMGPEREDGRIDPTKYSAVRRIIENQQEGLLRLQLFVELYGSNTPDTNRCAPWWIIRQNYQRETIGVVDDYVLHVFRPTLQISAELNALTEPYLIGAESSQSILQRGVNRLLTLGLIDCIPHLVTAETHDGDIIHPLGQVGTAALQTEQRMGQAAQDAGSALLRIRRQSVTPPGLVVPVYVDFSEPQVVGMLRPRLLPYSSDTRAWRDRQEEWKWWSERHREIAEALEAQPPERQVP